MTESLVIPHEMAGRGSTLPTLAFDRHHKGHVYVKLIADQRRVYLGSLPESATPIPDLVLSFVERLPMSDVDTIRELIAADKSLPDPDRKQGRSKASNKKAA